MVFLNQEGNLGFKKPQNTLFLLFVQEREQQETEEHIKYWKKISMLYISLIQVEYMTDTLIFGKITHLLNRKVTIFGGISNLIEKKSIMKESSLVLLLPVHEEVKLQ